MKIRPLRDTNDKQQVINLQNEWISSKLLPQDYSPTEFQFKEETTLVCEINGKIVGYTVFLSKHNIELGLYEIESLFVTQSYRGKNIDKELIKATEQTIKDRGGNKIEICPVTTRKKEKLKYYYKRLGYEELIKKDKHIMHKLLV
jgi:GNAT superfamily N-acetyltransferase